MDQNETGCEASERPIQCANNSGFFGCATTMNMCSNCYGEAVLRDDREKLAASSIENFVNGTSSKSNLSIVTGNAKVKTEIVEASIANPQVSLFDIFDQAEHGSTMANIVAPRV